MPYQLVATPQKGFSKCHIKPQVLPQGPPPHQAMPHVRGREQGDAHEGFALWSLQAGFSSHSSWVGTKSPLHPSLLSLGPWCLERRTRHLPPNLLTSRTSPKLGYKTHGGAHQQQGPNLGHFPAQSCRNDLQINIVSCKERDLNS